MKDPVLGLGGAPTRATTIPDDGERRKQHPVATGVLDYFPDALVAISHLSWQGNQQHNLGQALHWNRAKSGDEADAMIRHFLQRGTLDEDGIRHSAKMAWRALALLQKELEAARLTVQLSQSSPEQSSLTDREYPVLVRNPHTALDSGGISQPPIPLTQWYKASLKTP